VDAASARGRRRRHPSRVARRPAARGCATRRGGSVIAADRPDRPSARLLAIDAYGTMRHLPRAALASLFGPADLVVANDCATLPASLHGTHGTSGAPIEVRLAAWMSLDDPTRFAAIAFGAGDYRTPTEHRPPPPSLSPGDRLLLGPLAAVVEHLIDHP